MKKTILTIAITSLTLVTSCGPSEREILIRECDKTMAEMTELTNRYEESSQDYLHKIRRYQITGDVSDKVKMDDAELKNNELKSKLDSIHGVIDSQLSKIPKN
jgi:major membrane immunogen (membrane-anchored lipoprotein)